MDIEATLSAIGLALLWAAVFLVPLGLAFAVVHYLVTQPLRWLEQAQLFLEVVEAGLNEGIGAEQALLAVTERHGRAVGARFHRLAALLEKGVRLSAALEKVPRLLPPQLVALIRVGEEIGDLRRVVPAGRQILGGDLRHLRHAESGMIALALVTTGSGLFLFWVLSVGVFPKFQELAKDMEATPPALFVWLTEHTEVWFLAQGMFLGATMLAGFLYLSGPPMAAWLEARAPRVSGWFFHWLPWRRRRMQRDFSLMVALLLDAEVPEEKAVQLAAEVTANGPFKLRAHAVVADLRRGVKLPEALRRLDDAGELSWRMSFTKGETHSFVAALAGWHLTLETQAAQQEQAAHHATALALVLWNGVSVGVIGVTVFLFLITLYDAVGLW